MLLYCYICTRFFMHFLFLKLHNGGNHCKFETWYFWGSYYKNKSELGWKAKEMLYGIVIRYIFVLNDVFNLTLYFYKIFCIRYMILMLKSSTPISMYIVFKLECSPWYLHYKGDNISVHESLRNLAALKNITQTAQT